MLRLSVALAALVTVIFAAACGSSGSAPPAPAEPLTIEEALASSGGNPVAVRGYIVAPAGAATELCSTLLESYPPQCGGASLVVEGLDLSTIDGLTGTNDPSLAQVQWTDGEITLIGSLEENTLVVGEPS